MTSQRKRRAYESYMRPFRLWSGGRRVGTFGTRRTALERALQSWLQCGRVEYVAGHYDSVTTWRNLNELRALIESEKGSEE